MTRAFLDLGSNVDRERNVFRALLHLDRRLGVLRTSSIYETAPVGPAGQPPFYNLAVEVETALTPEELRDLLRDLEESLGRVRTGDRYAPRSVDLDLTLYGDLVARGEDWSLPHPQVATEAFVLIPLAELEPDRLHPLLGRPLSALAADLQLAPGALRVVSPPLIPG